MQTFERIQKRANQNCPSQSSHVQQSRRLLPHSGMSEHGEAINANVSNHGIEAEMC